MILTFIIFSVAIDPTQSLFFSSVSAALIHAALEKVAHRDGLMLYEVLALPPGPERRRFHDDITCTVVYISQVGSSEDETEALALAIDSASTTTPTTPTAVDEQELSEPVLT